jgi:hypothetical protein
MRFTEGRIRKEHASAHFCPVGVWPILQSAGNEGITVKVE